jgi:hypothetical protein
VTYCELNMFIQKQGCEQLVGLPWGCGKELWGGPPWWGVTQPGERQGLLAQGTRWASQLSDRTKVTIDLQWSLTNGCISSLLAFSTTSYELS